MVIKIEQKTLEKVLEYLSRRPYAEVAGLIQKLSEEVKKSLQEDKKDECNDK